MDKKCPKCQNDMVKGVNSTPRGGILFWARQGGGKLSKWLTSGGEFEERGEVVSYRCVNCGFIENYTE